MVRVLCHSDECSGTTIDNDGTKYYWTEGAHRDVVAVLPGGEVIRFNPVHPGDHEQHRLRLDEITEGGDYESSPMTRADEAEWRRAMKAEATK